MKKVIVFVLVCVGFEGLLGYSIHMFIGGQVSPDREQTIIIIAMLVAAVVLVFMGIDIIKHQRRH